MALQTATFSYGSLEYQSYSNSYILELTVREEAVSAANNTSDVSYVLKLISGANNRFDLYHIGATVSLGGVPVGNRDRYSTAQVSLGYNSSVELLSGTAVIPHSDDGTRNMAVAFSIDMESGRYVPGPVSVADRYMALTAIPRESTIGATDANIGAVSLVAVTRHSDSFTHSIAYAFGNLTGYITASGGVSSREEIFSAVSVPFTVPESFYTQIPNAPSGVGTLTVRTYAGGVQVGSPRSCQITATAARSQCTPELSWSLTDVNETTKVLTGDPGRMIRYFSTARCVLHGAPKNSAWLTEATIGGEAVELDSAGGGSRDIPGIETGSLTLSVKDSRGYTRTETATAELIPYRKLTNNAVGKRTDITTGEAQLIFSGAYYDGSFGAAGNTLTIRYRPAGTQKYTAVGNVTTADGKYSATVTLSGLDYRSSYSYEVEVSDKLMCVTRTVTIGHSTPVFDWGEKDFQFHVPVYMNSIATIQNLYSMNGMMAGGIAFGTNTTQTISIRDRCLLLVGIAGNNGSHGLFLIHCLNKNELTEAVRLSGTLEAGFALDSGALTVTCHVHWSYGWYIGNSSYADISMRT